MSKYFLKKLYAAIILIMLPFSVHSDNIFDNVKRFTLKNGIDVISLYNEGSDVFSIKVGIKLTSIIENTNNAGIRNLLLNILLRSTKSMSAYDLAVAIEEIGATVAPILTRDYMGIGAVSLNSFSSELVDILYDIVCNPSFDGYEEEKNRAIQLSNVQKNIWNEVLDLWMLKSLKTSYRLDPTGYDNSIKKISLEDIKKLYNSGVSGDNIVIVIVGKFKDTHYLKDLLKPFDKILTGKKIFQSPVEPILSKFDFEETKNVDSSAFAIGIDGIKRGSSNYLEWLIMSDYLSNEMDNKLRQENGLGYGARASAVSVATGGYLILYSDISNNSNLNKGYEMATFLLENSMKDISDSDFDLSKNMVRGNLARANQTSSEMASSLLSNYIYGLPQDYTYKLLKRIDSVKKVDIIKTHNINSKKNSASVKIKGLRE